LVFNDFFRMQLLDGFDSAAGYQGGYVSIGNFDGVHRGHQSMISRLVDRAQASGVPAVVLTFDPHPIKLLRPELAPPSLSTIERKAELLGGCGVDFVVAYPTDRALLELTSEEFFRRIVLDELAACGMIEGPNFQFGHNRAGDVGTLKSLCDENGLTLDIVDAVETDGRVVSSSIVRSLIHAGELAEAAALLGHAYRLRGTVVEGAGRGRSLGFPTANLGGIATMLPADGVYAARCAVDGEQYPAAIHIGPNPTFDDDRQKVELHLIGFDGDLYSKVLAVDLVDRVRGTQSFESASDLQSQVREDLKRVCAVVNQQNDS
jgi:riboflavin kinase/FMN adenylyltransferase